jgi:hypothetical protein
MKKISNKFVFKIIHGFFLLLMKFNNKFGKNPLF